MLDATGCQNMAANSWWNTSLANAPVDKNSAAMIAQAETYATGGMNINAPKTYAIVPASQPMVSVGANGRSTNPPPFPIPSYGAQLLTSGDSTMSLVRLTAPPRCDAWEGYNFKPSGSGWVGYSGGGPIDMTGPAINYPGGQPCDGVSGDCPIEIGANLTTWEANHGATHPILHTLHAESPSGMTCDQGSGSCISTQRIRLNRSRVARPSDPNAAAVYDAMVTFGLTVDDNGCCWGLYIENESNLDGRGQSGSVPSAVASFASSLRVSNFDVVDPPYSP